MNKTLVCLILAAAVMAPLGYAELLSNYVTNGTITVDASRDDWSGLSSYTEDGQDMTVASNDWRTFTMAHDNTNLYIRYTTWKGPGYAGGYSQYTIFIDTDQNRDTGFYGGGGYLSIGAELMIEAMNVYTYAGTDQSSWSWSSIGAASYNESSNDYELAVSKSWLSMTNGVVFNWIAGSFAGSEVDFVPNDANGGETGGYHSYAIPEPASVALLSIGVLCALALRSRSAKV